MWRVNCIQVNSSAIHSIYFIWFSWISMQSIGSTALCSHRHASDTIAFCSIQLSLCTFYSNALRCMAPVATSNWVILRWNVRREAVIWTWWRWSTRCWRKHRPGIVKQWRDGCGGRLLLFQNFLAVRCLLERGARMDIQQYQSKLCVLLTCSFYSFLTFDYYVF